MYSTIMLDLSRSIAGKRSRGCRTESDTKKGILIITFWHVAETIGGGHIFNKLLVSSITSTSAKVFSRPSTSTEGHFILSTL